MSSTSHIEEMLEAAIKIARIGGDRTLRYFKSNIEIEQKDDETPVTQADRECEQVMRSEISEKYPNHGILGEEFGRENPKSSVQWILDPIDGTFSFIHGVPLYTTLVGILVDNEPVAGVIYAPALDELCEAGKDLGARLNGTECTVRECKSLSDATMLTTDVTTHSVSGYERPFRELLNHSKLHRTWGDAYGHMLVATGRADLMFDPILNVWDAAPLLTLLSEAGGIFCDTAGNETIVSGNGISCSKALLPEVLNIFKNYADS